MLPCLTREEKTELWTRRLQRHGGDRGEKTGSATYTCMFGANDANQLGAKKLLVSWWPEPSTYIASMGRMRESSSPMNGPHRHKAPGSIVDE